MKNFVLSSSLCVTYSNTQINFPSDDAVYLAAGVVIIRGEMWL